MAKYDMGYAKIMHGETRSFSVVLNTSGTITQLNPAPGESTKCLGTLAMQCASYGKTNVSWNVAVGQYIKKTELPYTVTCIISFEAWLGEYYGERQGEPDPSMGLWFYPEFYFEPETPPPECYVDADCPEGYICQNGVCVEAPPPECTVDADCPEGYICENGKCVEAPPPPPPECYSDADCPEGYICQDGICVESPPCSAHTNENDCLNAGCHWYNNECHSEPEPEEEPPKKRVLIQGPFKCWPFPIINLILGYER